jgi:hypothetical protein
MNHTHPCPCRACRENSNRAPAIRAFYIRAVLVKRYGNVDWLTKILYNCHDFGGTEITRDPPYIPPTADLREWEESRP